MKLYIFVYLLLNSKSIDDKTFKEKRTMKICQTLTTPDGDKKTTSVISYWNIFKTILIRLNYQVFFMLRMVLSDR